MALMVLGVDKGDWGLNFYSNFTRNKNKVLDLKGVESVDIGAGQSVSSRAVEGHALGVLWGTSALKDDNGDYILKFKHTLRNTW